MILIERKELSNTFYQRPELCLKKMEIADKVCTETNKFILGGSFNIDTFERMQLLRGPSQLYMDIMDLFKLRDIVHEYHLKELEAWAKTNSDGIMFADDWGSQKSLSTQDNAIFGHLNLCNPDSMGILILKIRMA